ncbi:MAG: glucosaminidase domain-containing protein [Campylobacterota bacterium]
MFSFKIFTISALLFTTFAFNLKAALPQEYYKINATEDRKEYFYNYFYELIKNENKKILKEREFIKSFLNKNILSINFDSPNFEKLLEIKEKYKIDKLLSVDVYLKKIDVIPPSMALAQAAVESGWGKSRFIKEANNVFGHWTYNPQIGMMPLSRDEDATHYIRIFKTIQDSISAYMLNLNRNNAYKEFQNLRYKQREQNQLPNGLKLSQTMLKYSGIGHNYLEILGNLIKNSNLQKYDEMFYNEID